LTWDELLSRVSGFDSVIVFWEESKVMFSPEAVGRPRKIGEAVTYAVLIGPEGGLSAEEIRQLERQGAKTYSLGTQVLKVDTLPWSAWASFCMNSTSLVRDMLRFAIHTLGCKVNQYETESITNDLLSLGLELVDFADRADLYVINTCTVTGTSDHKSRQWISKARKGPINCCYRCWRIGRAGNRGLNGDIVLKPGSICWPLWCCLVLSKIAECGSPRQHFHTERYSKQLMGATISGFCIVPTCVTTGQQAARIVRRPS
jgi:hypothetical protein